MKKNVASQVIGAQMVSATDGSAFTGSVTVAVTGDAGTQATGSVGSGACTHEGGGFHTYAPAQAETNYDHVAFTFSGTGAVPATIQLYTQFPQTGDSYARLGAPAGASVSADVAAIKADTAAILVDTGTTLPATLDTIDNFLDTEIAAILADTNELQTDWANGGRLDLLLDGAASAGDPWTTALPGAYGSGTAGKIIGDNINATISSRASQTSVDTVDDLLDTEVAAIKTVVDAVKVKTDQLAFTAANKVDANVLNVNSQSIGASKPYDTAS